jgi:hypothetical protein
VTDGDATRIHARLDEIVAALTDQAISIAKLSSSFESMLTATAKAEITREQTCPHHGYMLRLGNRIERMESSVRVLKWLGAIVTTALIIPGLQWFGRELWRLIIS